ncbi:MAG: hypothetical protein HRU14_16485, partial [Planctomycetes bacterium]|nr:hypothetical protein [Planctomycetota bacterium]
GLSVGVARAQALYGVFAQLPLFFVWIYLFWAIALLGAEISFAVQNLSLYRREVRDAQRSPADREALGLRVAVAVASQFQSGDAPLDTQALSETLDAPVRGVRDVAARLVDAGLLARQALGTGGEALGMAQSPSRVQVADVLDHMIVLDHPGADFFAYGGAAVAGGTGTAVLDPAEFSAVLQRQGRVRTFMFQTSGYGAAQFHLETPSTLGAHHVAAGRNETSASEYDKEEGACDPALVESTVLVRVPPGRDRVDLAVKGHGTALDNTRRYCGFTMRLVDYSAAGRLWLVANADNGSLDHLATGNAPSALVLASGNYTYGNDILPIVAESVATSANLFNHNLYLNGGLPDYPLPQPRLVDETASFSDCAQPSCAIAEIPEFVIPMPVDRPRMNTKLPGMLDVTAPPYNAKGDGETDDTVAIQAAFDDAAIGDEGPDSLSGKAIYFPAGTYKISDPLYYVHREAPVQPSDLKFGWGELGGWIAGAGSEETFIVQEEDESVFATEGARFMSFQGITYRATPYTPDGPIEGVPNVSLDNDEEVGGPTNTLYFYDSHFDGGDSAVGIVPVIDHNIMGSEMTFVNSKFSNARTGVYIPDTGNNAMLDGGYNVEFSNLVESAIDTGNGSFYLTHATISGIGEKVIDAGGGYPYQYLYGVTMDAPAFLDFDSVIEFVIIENSVFTTTSPNVDMFKLNGGGGIIFLHSEFAGFANSGGDTLTVDNINRMGYGVNLFSDLPGWDSHSLSRWKIDSVISATQSGNSAPGVPTLGPAGGALLAALLARMATGRLRRR